MGQARKAAELGVDVIIAQGSEAGGQGMALGVGAMALLPQVADAVDPIPILAAGGGGGWTRTRCGTGAWRPGSQRGDALPCLGGSLGRQGVKRMMLQAESEDVVRFDAWEVIFPPAGGGAYATVPRVLRTPFVEQWLGRTQEARREAGAAG